eukprot:1160605-Pelagomonas_calceolata.AAC.6
MSECSSICSQFSFSYVSDETSPTTSRRKRRHFGLRPADFLHPKMTLIYLEAFNGFYEPGSAPVQRNKELNPEPETSVTMMIWAKSSNLTEVLATGTQAKAPQTSRRVRPTSTTQNCSDLIMET